MEIYICSDLDLLGVLVGKKTAEKLYQGSLMTLLCTTKHQKLAAAMELARRALRERL